MSRQGAQRDPPPCAALFCRQTPCAKKNHGVLTGELFHLTSVFCKVKPAKNQRSLCLLGNKTPRGEGVITLQFNYSQLEGTLKKVLGDDAPFSGLHAHILGRGVASKESWGCHFYPLFLFLFCSSKGRTSGLKNARQMFSRSYTPPSLLLAV